MPSTMSPSVRSLFGLVSPQGKNGGAYTTSLVTHGLTRNDGLVMKPELIDDIRCIQDYQPMMRLGSKLICRSCGYIRACCEGVL